LSIFLLRFTLIDVEGLQGE